MHFGFFHPLILFYPWVVDVVDWWWGMRVLSCLQLEGVPKKTEFTNWYVIDDEGWWLNGESEIRTRWVSTPPPSMHTCPAFFDRLHFHLMVTILTLMRMVDTDLTFFLQKLYIFISLSSMDRIRVLLAEMIKNVSKTGTMWGGLGRRPSYTYTHTGI